MKMINKITFKELCELIESGSKIYKIDESIGEIEIIEGIVISDYEQDILISKYSIDLTDTFKNFALSDKFQTAIVNPKKRGVMLIDVADYSKGNSLYFAAILTVFNTLIKQTVRTLKTVNKPVEQIIPTGDGCYLIFNENMNRHFFKIVFMIINEMNILQYNILKKFSKDLTFDNKLHLRISCTLNETDFFCDVAGNRNC